MNRRSFLGRVVAAAVAAPTLVLVSPEPPAWCGWDSARYQKDYTSFARYGGTLRENMVQTRAVELWVPGCE